ncbi:Phox-associated domain Phox-like Sorting nexin C-terminal [Euphorbia peplus]|nr:Phox-associated domain Phox-like Sorting nexin C-terminal [Euphorbia peplus]
MNLMEEIQDLIEEAKVRILYWALCIFAVTYFLSHTSSSMWINLPISILFLAALRILSNEVEFSWKKHRRACRQSYLSHLEKKQLSVNDSRLSSALPPPRWKRKIDSPVVEAAINELIDKILKDFVVDLWYSEITPDKEAPELMRSVIMDAIGEISGRVKEINLVDLLTRDIIDLVGDHLELFRRNLADIGADVMSTLSTDERDERLKHHLMASKELHPALISPESEYKVLQRLIGGILAVVLRPQEVQCPLVRTIARELVTCLILQPVMNLASPVYINEIIEYILVAIKDGSIIEVTGGLSSGGGQSVDHLSKTYPSPNSQRNDVISKNNNLQGIDMISKIENQRETSSGSDANQQEAIETRLADWARVLEAANQRRTEVLTPENLENMWTKGRNYKKKEAKKLKVGVPQPIARGSATNNADTSKYFGRVLSSVSDENTWQHDGEFSFENKKAGIRLDITSHLAADENKSVLKRSSSTSDLKTMTLGEKTPTGNGRGTIISEFYGSDFGRLGEDHAFKRDSDIVLYSEGLHVPDPKLKCRVMGAYFEKIGSKSFAVYSIAVTDAENRTWFVKRRYRNFERLHRHLKDIPNYTLHLPPKRIFSSSTEDAFVHQRCIHLDKYLQDLLSIANVAEQHEVWDFLSASSKNYSFGKSPSVMKTLAVNVDDAVDDIVRQFKGVSDGLIRKVAGSPSSLEEINSSVHSRNLSWHADEMNKPVLRQDTEETMNSFSDNEDNLQQESHKPVEGSSQQTSERKQGLKLKSELINRGDFAAANSATATSSRIDDPVGMPPEWTPSNVSLPLLNLVDKIFQLNRRGWLRRQVFWMSKQILQLVMEDAIDDLLLRQIYLLRREDIVAQGIRYLQDILWPDGVFFTRVRVGQGKGDDANLNPVPFQMNQLGANKVYKQVSGSFEEQLEAARRASDIKKMLFDGAPTAMVSLLGAKQYKRSARDIFYFTQSTICMKQLAYAILELVLVSVLPELKDLLLDIHGKTRAAPS